MRRDELTSFRFPTYSYNTENMGFVIRIPLPTTQFATNLEFKYRHYGSTPKLITIITNEMSNYNKLLSSLS